MADRILCKCNEA